MRTLWRRWRIKRALQTLSVASSEAARAHEAFYRELEIAVIAFDRRTI